MVRGGVTGRVAVVTGGAGSGIGGSTARRLAADGAAVAVLDVHERRTAEMARSIEDGGARAVGLTLDVADRDAVNEAVTEVERTLGPVDILVNSAAVNALGPLRTMEPDQWDRVTGVGLTGAFNLIRAVLPGMVERRRGAIVNISSIAAWLGSANEAPYAAAKAGLQSLTRSVANEGGPHGVRCNAIAPGYIESRFVAANAERFAAEIERIPLRRLGTPDEVASLIAFLVSDESAYITGETIVLAGGWYMHA